MWVWSYPTIDPVFRDLLMNKCSLKPVDKDDDQTTTTVGLDYSYGHLSNVWYYLNNVHNTGRSPLDQVLVY